MKAFFFYFTFLFSISISAQNSLDWAKSIGSAMLSEASKDVVVNQAGESYVIGTYQTTVDINPNAGVLTFNGDSHSGYILKLDANGNMLWAKNFSLGFILGDMYKIEFDNSGNLLVVGECEANVDLNPGTNTNLSQSNGVFILSLDTSGNYLWHQLINYTLSQVDFLVHSLHVTGANNIIISGKLIGEIDANPNQVFNQQFLLSAFNNSSAGVLIKLNSLGNFIWAQAYEGDGEDEIFDVETDSNENIYIVGRSESTDIDLDPGSNNLSTYMPSSFLLKLSSSGSLIWWHYLFNSIYSFDKSLIEITSTGDIWLATNYSSLIYGDPSITYDFADQGSGNKLIFVKFNPSGDITDHLIYSLNGAPILKDLIIDNSNIIRFVGTSGGTYDYDPGPGVYNLSSLTTTTCAITLYPSGTFGSASILRTHTHSNSYSEPTAFAYSNNTFFVVGYYVGYMDVDPSASTSTLQATSTSIMDAFMVKMGLCTAPSSPTASSETICSGTQANLSAVGTSVSWYDAANGGQLLSSSSTYTTPNLSSNTTYYIQDSSCLVSNRTPVSVTVQNGPNLNLNVANLSVCLNESVVINANSNGTQFEWTGPANFSTNSQNLNFAATNSNQEGQYTITAFDLLGCSSTQSFMLTIHPIYEQTVDVNSCESYLWSANGQTYTQSGTYTELLQSQNGCDSIVHLNLTINQGFSQNQTTTACQSYTWEINNQTYTASGVYEVNLQTNNGCDSVYTLNLTIENVNAVISQLNESTLTTDITNADAYTWYLCGTQTVVGSSPTITTSENVYVIVQQGVCADTTNCFQIALNEITDLANKFIVFPNPTMNKLFVESQDSKITQILITTMEGKLCRQYLDLNKAKVELNLESLESGNYLIHCETENNTFIQKVVIQ